MSAIVRFQGCLDKEYGCFFVEKERSLMAIPTDVFDAQFVHFCEIIQRASGSEFRSFGEGIAAEWESYKPRLWECARGLMDLANWHEDTIGMGYILDRVIASIEIRD